MNLGDGETQAGIHTAIEEMLDLSFVEYAAWIPDSLRPKGASLSGMTQVKTRFWVSCVYP
ncbi:MAG: hypothetical protein ABIE07_11290 [Candidatus Zixiibacteriota bacterium]